MAPTGDPSPQTLTVTLGTRKSQLAMVQTYQVRDVLQKLYPNYNFPILPMSTTGDIILDKALSKIGEKSLFTKELELALHEGKVDLVVHSLKDLPTTLPPGMMLGAVLERENPHDALVFNEKFKDQTLDSIPEGSVIGTSSVRRIAQLKRRFPHLQFQDVRGNLNTRLAKLDADDSPYAGIVLAVAGLVRIDMGHRISQVLDPSLSLHAVSQGALGVECRSKDTRIVELLAPLNHFETRVRCVCERSLMRTLEGGCSVPIGVNSRFEGRSLHLRGLVASVDGKEVAEDDADVEIPDDADAEQYANELGETVAKKLLDLGARQILDQIHHH
jgi:hydroxymethylbilane synthase